MAADTARHPERFAGLADFVRVWNQGQGLATPLLHRQILTWLERHWERDGRELLLLVFRDAGKSTLVGLFAAWLLHRQPSLRILVLSAEQALARKMVRNVKRIIERHPLCRGLKPPQRDQWAMDQFTVARPAELRDPSMLARGLSGNITGSRADVVICDDVEVPGTAGTAAKREELRARLAEIDYVLVPGGLQLYVGTPHTFFSIYAAEPRAETNETAPFLDGFRRLVLPVIDERGRSRWPVRYPLNRIAAIRKRRGPASFASQMLLQPTAAADGRLDPARLNGYAEEINAAEAQGHLMLTLGARRLVSAACCWDPAFGSAAKTGDRSAIAAVFADAEGRRFIHRVAYLSFDPAREKEEDAASQLCRQAAEFVAALHLPAVQVETNGLGRFLPGLLRRALAAIGCGAAVTEQTARAPKAVRILQAFDAPLAAGLLHAHDSVLASPFRTELREWRPGASGRGADDGLDAVAACLLADPVRLGPVARPPRRDWRALAPLLRADNDFEP